MIPFRPDIPPHAPQVIRGLHPDLKQLIKAAIRAISTNPECGGPLQRELDGGQVPKEALEEGEEWHRKDSNDMG